LPANGHRPPPSQAREATCLACIALEASGLGNLGRQGQQRQKSGQGERTGMLFDCIWLGRTVKVHSHWLCIAAPASSGRAPPNDFCIQTPHFAWLVLNLPQTQITKYHKGQGGSQAKTC